MSFCLECTNGSPSDSVTHLAGRTCRAALMRRWLGSVRRPTGRDRGRLQPTLGPLELLRRRALAKPRPAPPSPAAKDFSAPVSDEFWVTDVTEFRTPTGAPGQRRYRQAQERVLPPLLLGQCAAGGRLDTYLRYHRSGCIKRSLGRLIPDECRALLGYLRYSSGRCGNAFEPLRYHIATRVRQ